MTHYVYVDNLGCLCSSEERAETIVESWVTEFEKDGLLLHKATVTSEATTVLGNKLDGTQMRMGITDERLVKIQAGVKGLLQRRKVAGWAREVVIGHLTFCGLANRGLLTVFHTVYRFMRRHYLEAVELWPECRAEL